MSEIVIEKATRTAEEKATRKADGTTIKERMQDILLDISWRALARRYFGKSSSWRYITRWMAYTAVTTQALPPESKLSSKVLYMN